MSARTISMSEAVRQKIRLVRDPKWANPDAYMLIDLFDSGHGPWIHLYDRKTQEAIGQPTPQDLLCTMIDWNDPTGCVPFEGQIDKADKAPKDREV